MRSIVTRTAHETTPGMAARAAQVQARHGSAILGSFISRAHHEQLVHCKLGVVPVTSGDVPAQFQIARGQQFCVQYLLTAVNEAPTGEWVNPRALPHGDFFFRGPHDLPAEKLSETFGDNVDLFRSASAALGGRALDMADASFEFRMLPRVPVAIALWAADDEFLSFCVLRTTGQKAWTPSRLSRTR